MEALKIKRGRVKGMLTRMVSFIEGVNADTPLESLSIRLEKLDELWAEFNSIQDQFAEFPDDISSNEWETEQIQFESRYYSAKESLVKALNARKALTPQPSLNQDIVNRLVHQQANFFERFSSTRADLSATEATTETKLPKMRIPPFSGEYKEWVSFRDLCKALALDNTHSSPTQKFHYLKAFLKDEAAALLRHIPISEANYEQAWARLMKRYDKKGHIIRSYIQNFIGLPSITQGSVTGLRKITDGADEVIRGLQALDKRAEDRDPG